MDVRLRDLYAENTDWNKVIRNLSADAIEEQQAMNEFESAFENLPEDISMANLSPKMSTVVYKTQSTTWTPEKIAKVYGGRILDTPAINQSEHVAWFVTKDIETVRWGDVKSIAQTSYSLFVAYWDQDNHLLYINSSNNEGVYEDLAKALCGEGVEIHRGANVYRIMASLNRRIATNVGLLDATNRDNRFEMHVGADVINALSAAARRSKSQTNIFAHGVDSSSGERVTIGASLKGRVWSHKASYSIKHWMEWCQSVGVKLKDSDIDPSEVMDGFIVPTALDERPENMYALALEWPSDAYLDLEENLVITVGNESAPLIDVDFEITEFNQAGPIPFQVVLPEGAVAQYKAYLSGSKMTFTSEGTDAIIGTSRTSHSLKDYLNENGIRIMMEKEAVIEPNMIMIQPVCAAPAYDKDRIEVLDWIGDGVNIRHESRGQGHIKDENSIQARMITELKVTNNWDVIIDDDGSGEIADLVALKIEGHELIVELVHCKYSHGDTPGRRLLDLYEVSGQAQRSIARRRNLELLIENLIRRERKRRKSGKTGIVHGTAEQLQNIADRSRLLARNFTITIAQPGVSKAVITNEQLELISATEKYIRDSGGNTPLRIIVSP